MTQIRKIPICVICYYLRLDLIWVLLHDATLFYNVKLRKSLLKILNLWLIVDDDVGLVWVPLQIVLMV